MRLLRVDRSPVRLFLFGLVGLFLMLGAVFMATDMVASPITNAGCWLYGVLIGVLVVAVPAGASSGPLTVTNTDTATTSNAAASNTIHQ